MRRIKIDLDQREYDALMKASAEDMRTPDKEVKYLVVRELKERDFLVEDKRKAGFITEVHP